MHVTRKGIWAAILALNLSLPLYGCESGPTMGQEDKSIRAASDKGGTLTRTGSTFDTAGNMFAYAEFELSGELMAERLGLNLDLLDPANVNQPTPFDYTAGIESYEYSEEGMYEVVEKSGLGLHLVNGPVNHSRGNNPAESLAKRFPN